MGGRGSGYTATERQRQQIEDARWAIRDGLFLLNYANAELVSVLQQMGETKLLPVEPVTIEQLQLKTKSA